MINVENEILVYAVRYALGRQSGAVLDVVNSVHANVDNIEEKYKAVMLKDILEYLRMVNDKYQYKDIIESWKAIASILYAKTSQDTRDWLANPMGGDIDRQTLDSLQ